MKIRRSYNLCFVIRDKEDYDRIKKSAKLNKFLSKGEFIRALISANFEMMGWPPLKRVSLRRAVCIHGHKYTKENTIWKTKGNRTWKICRTCKQINENRQYYRRTDKLGIKRRGKRKHGELPSRRPR